jgi:broad specificity phosphatase PhoE
MILLARHGQTDDNVEPVRVQGSRDVPLNDTGRAQARALAARVRAEQPDVAALWSSQLVRARETAEIVGAELGLEPRVDARLAETARGDWEGRRWDEIATADPEGVAAWRRAGAGFRFPGGESLAEQQARVLAALADVRAAASPALVVCHGGSIRVALCAADPRGLDAFHAWDVPNGTLVRL